MCLLFTCVCVWVCSKVSPRASKEKQKHLITNFVYQTNIYLKMKKIDAFFLILKVKLFWKVKIFANLRERGDISTALWWSLWMLFFKMSDYLVWTCCWYILFGIKTNKDFLFVCLFVLAMFERATNFTEPGSILPTSLAPKQNSFFAKK